MNPYQQPCAKCIESGQYPAQETAPRTAPRLTCPLATHVLRTSNRRARCKSPPHQPHSYRKRPASCLFCHSANAPHAKRQRPNGRAPAALHTMRLVPRICSWFFKRGSRCVLAGAATAACNRHAAPKPKRLRANGQFDSSGIEAHKTVSSALKMPTRQLQPCCAFCLEFAIFASQKLCLLNPQPFRCELRSP